MQQKFTIRMATPADAAAAIDFKEQCWRWAYADIFPPEVFETVYGAESKSGIVSYWEQLITGGAKAWLAELAIESAGATIAAAETPQDVEIIGIAMANPSRDADSPTEIELSVLYVSPQHQNSGVGTALLQRALGDSPAMLWMLQGNQRGQRFYEAKGFRFDGGARKIFSSHGDFTELRILRQ
ncbi:GNAT family N-acetyltransferase [Canibacter oris]|uniref:Ribosomal protein S18 acetylase RimI-like enzyme n=1 Tax=Canibacter oris TaxID=1365628 RepID=A0A840DNR4_9MICO|nr:GNAT family N-acetyltransferase [Canibacter oris]MBB4071678.1 ribosomal protein S18 acetylase RimI-like enzyme [Canibacter oris]